MGHLKEIKIRIYFEPGGPGGGALIPPRDDKRGGKTLLPPEVPGPDKISSGGHFRAEIEVDGTRLYGCFALDKAAIRGQDVYLPVAGGFLAGGQVDKTGSGVGINLYSSVVHGQGHLPHC